MSRVQSSPAGTSGLRKVRALALESGPQSPLEARADEGTSVTGVAALQWNYWRCVRARSDILALTCNEYYPMTCATTKPVSMLVRWERADVGGAK